MANRTDLASHSDKSHTQDFSGCTVLASKAASVCQNHGDNPFFKGNSFLNEPNTDI